MTAKLTHMTLSGFRGFLREVTIPFAPGFTVITGKNGAGKSTICDGLEYAITQQLSRFSEEDTERGEHISDYVWWRGQERPDRFYLEVGVRDDQGTPFSLAGGPDGFNSQSSIDKLLLGHDLPEDAPKQLVQTTLLRDETLTKFSTDMSEGARFDFVRQTVGVGGLAPLEKAARDLLKPLDKLTDSAERTYEQTRADLSSIGAEISQLRSVAQRTLAESIDEVRKRISPLLPQVPSDLPELAEVIRRELVSLRTSVDQLQALTSALEDLQIRENELKRSASVLEKLRQTRQEADRDAAQGRQVVGSLQSKLESERRRSPLNAAFGQLREQGRRIGLRDGRCPLCGSSISEKDFQSHLDEIDRSLKEQSEQLANIIQEETTATANYQRLRSRFEDSERALEQAEALPRQLQRRRVELEQTAKATKVELSVASVSKQATDIRQRIQMLEDALNALETSRALIRITQLERERESKQEQLRRDQVTLDRFKAARLEAKNAGDAIRRVSGELVDERLASLSPLLSELYTRLRPHGEWTRIQYSMRGDIKRFLSFEVGSGINPRFVFSSGQRRALALAFLLAVHLSRTWTSLETLILDDPIQHIDDFRALHLTETLASIRQRGRQVICMVENRDLADLLCRRLRAESGGEGLRIEMEFVPGRGVGIKNMTQIQPLEPRVLLTA